MLGAPSSNRSRRIFERSILSLTLPIHGDKKVTETGQPFRGSARFWNPLQSPARLGQPVPLPLAGPCSPPRPFPGRPWGSTGGTRRALHPVPTCVCFPHTTWQFSGTSWVSPGPTPPDTVGPQVQAPSCQPARPVPKRLLQIQVVSVLLTGCGLEDLTTLN